jgi:hypothetical protein
VRKEQAVPIAGLIYLLQRSKAAEAAAVEGAGKTVGDDAGREVARTDVAAALLPILGDVEAFVAEVHPDPPDVTRNPGQTPCTLSVMERVEVR